MGFFNRLFGTKAPPRRNSPPAGLRDRPLSSVNRVREMIVAPSLAFTPTQPKPSGRQLTGRQAELRRILQAFSDDRAHVVLYSERGRGKTSLSNMVVEALRRRGFVVARWTCDAESNFDSIMRGLMRDLPSSLLASPAVTEDYEGCEAALPSRTLRPGDVVFVPQRLACKGLVCLVDEFDRVEDARTRTQLADAIKQLSDRDVPLQFLVVGVSENLDEILGQHPSVQRNVLGVHLPLFTERDVEQLIVKGGRESGFTFAPAAIVRIAMLSRGMPYMAQLLGLRLAQAAAARDATDIEEEDFDMAVARLILDANPRITALYAGLTDRGRDQGMIHALQRVAIAPQDEWGRLEVLRLPDGLISVGGHWIDPGLWTRLMEAKLLAPVKGNDGLFVFAERNLMHHVLLLAARDTGAVSVEDEPAERMPIVLRPHVSNA
jgi:hypothetical protein